MRGLRLQQRLSGGALLGLALALLPHLPGSHAAGGHEIPFDSVAQIGDSDRCTTITAGRKATADGSVMTTHTNDCGECDFRIAKVPARDWPEGSMRPIYLFASAYPRRVEVGRSKTWDPSNLEQDLPQRQDWTPKFSTIIGHIPQVSHTYALIEGTYGIMNEHQVGIGESTCPGRFWTAPVTQGGKALLELSELTSIALERCKTARCAVETMGNLSTTYGYYGAQWDGEMADIIVEAGEALTVTDPTEAWVFHITPDDTGLSAVWVAQRVPDGHVTVVANQFIIRKVHRGDPDFLYSDNLWEVAKRNNLWKPEDGELDYLKVYGFKRTFPTYSTRRMWRVFTLAAPSLADSLPGDTDAWADDYPFSVAPDRPLTPQDLMRFQRDHFEGTKYDMTQGVAAGPYGDPSRYDSAPRPKEGVTLALASSGIYERSLSLFRTSYSFVTQSRSNLPASVARLWLCQYMPSMSVYHPIYVSAPELPDSLTVGSLFKYTKRSFFWAAATVGNWATRFYKYIRVDVEEKQRELEEPLEREARKVEEVAVLLLQDGRTDEALQTLQDFSTEVAAKTLTAWNDLFELLIAKYRDGYRLVDPDAAVFQQEYLFYPLWWLKLTGFFKSGTPLADTPSSQTDDLLDAADGHEAPAHQSKWRGAFSSTWSKVAVALLVSTMSALSLGLGVWIGQRQVRREYVSLNQRGRRSLFI